jgi:tetratricopeptide (TPR) repeat protein
MRVKLFSLFTLVALSFSAFAQDEATLLKYGTDKDVCEQNLSIYTEFYKQKSYADAYGSWTYLFNNAPKRTKNIYIHGAKIIKGLIKTVTDDTRKAVLVDSLMMVYDQRNTYYPGSEAKVTGYKGADLYKYKKGTTEGLQEAYAVLEDAFNIGGYTTSPRVLSTYFVVSTKLLNAKVLSIEDLLNLFSDLSSVISYKEAQLAQDIFNANEQESLTKKEAKQLKRNEDEKEKLSDVKDNLEKALAPYATCEKLVEMYTRDFEINKEDVTWLKRSTKLLNKKDCTDADIFFSISEALYNIDPSPSAAANMGIRSLKRQDYEKALEFYSYALDNEEDKLNKAQYAYRIAQTYSAMNKNKSAKSYALKAASFRNGWGDPYILIGDLYAKTSRKCGELQTEFLKRVGYWAAIDKYEYAVKIDSSVKGTAAERIVKYKEQMPSKTDIFTEGLINVPTYKIDCWYTETVNVKVPE